MVAVVTEICVQIQYALVNRRKYTYISLNKKKCKLELYNFSYQISKG